MADNGYRFTATSGAEYFVPDQDVLLCAVREPDTPAPGFPSWLVEFSASDVYYFRRFDGEAEYTLMLLGDGTYEFRDTDIDTVMYTMVPQYDGDVFTGYELTWDEYTTDDRPDFVSAENGLVLPTDEEGSQWAEYTIDLDHFVIPVYASEDLVSYDDDADSDDVGDSEEEDTSPQPIFYLDIGVGDVGESESALWNVASKEPVVFRLGSGTYDTQHRRVYSLGDLDYSVLFSDGGLLLYDGFGDRVGGASRVKYEDDEDPELIGGMASFSSVMLERYLEKFTSDSRRGRSEELRTYIWNACVDNVELCLDKLQRIAKMFLDAEYEWNSPTWPIDTPMNFMRAIHGTKLIVYGTPDGSEIRDEEGEVRYTITSDGSGDGTTWTVRGADGVSEYVVAPEGQGTYSVSGNGGTVTFSLFAEEAVEDFDVESDFGEYSETNKYTPISVESTGYNVGKPVESDDPFNSVTFAEFYDYIPLRKVGTEWLSYATKTQYYETPSDNLKYKTDIYDRWDKLRYRILKPELCDYADREIFSSDGAKVATMSLTSLVSVNTGEEVAKLYEDPAPLYSYQLFDNKQGSYNYLTRYANDMVVVVNQKGNVVCYVTPSGEYRSSVWYFFGTVGDGEIVDKNGNITYTFSRRGGDWNIYDADGDLVGHLFSATEPNNEWTIADGCQRLFTFLAEESTVVIGSSGDYTFRTKGGGTVIESRVVVQSNESGTLFLSILDENGEEIYRVIPSGSSYYCEAANGVAFDTADAYGTFSQGNMVLTRYWSVPYGRMMYSCTNDQPEGAFDEYIAGTGDDGGTRPLAYGVSGSGDVSGSGNSSVVSVSGVPVALAATSTSSSSSDAGSSGGLTSDGITDLIEQTSNYFDSVLGILTKGNNTAKGEDLDPENPLQIAHTETDGRLLADAVFTSSSNVSPSEELILADAYDYTQAVTRLSKVYSSGRSDYYKEAQDYNETQMNRLEYKKAAFSMTMEMAKQEAEKTGSG